MKQTTNTKKLALAGVLTALAIVGSFLSFPVAGSKCAPVQHMVQKHLEQVFSEELLLIRLLYSLWEQHRQDYLSM